MSTLALDLLGPLRLAIEGDAVEIRSLKGRALLSVLALEGPTPRERLATLLWQRDDQRALLSLRNALLAMRRDLGPLQDVLGAHGRHLFLAGELDVDVTRIPSLNGNALIGLWRGPALQDLVIRDSPPWDEWRDQHAAAITAQYLERLHGAAVQAARDGDLRLSERLATHALSVDPLSEQAATHLMQLYASTDRPDAARHLAATFRRGFLRGAAEPDQRPAPVPGTPALPAALPTALTSFVGRHRERHLLLDALTAPDARLVTVYGPGGIGKSRLAAEVARAYAALPGVQGIFHVALDGLSRPDDLAGAIAERLGLPPSRHLWHDIQRHIDQQAVLLVLDSFEGMVSETPAVLALLRGCLQLRVLVTSRQVLGSAAETVLDLGGLTLPEPGAGWPAGYGSEAVQLFEQRARQANLTFTLTPAVLPLVTGLCRDLGGNPLALELAAAWLRYTTLADLAQSLEANALTLATPRHDAPARHVSMRTVFEHSWQRLTERERTALRCLGVFPVGFSGAAALAITDLGPADLQALIDHSMLRFDGQRYSFHPLLRQFARERLDAEPALRGTLMDGHAAYYLDHLERLSVAASGGISRDLLTFFRAEEGHVLQGLEWSVAQGDYARLPGIVEAIQWDFALRSRVTDALTLLRGLLDRVPPVEARWAHVRAALLTSLGWYEQFIGDLHQAQDMCVRALEEARSAGDALQICRAANGLGEVYFRRGRAVLAVPLFTEAIRLVSNDVVRTFRIQANLGAAQAFAGQLDGARKTFRITQRALDSAEMTQTMDIVIHAVRRGVGAMEDLDFDHAVAVFETGLELAVRIRSEGQIWGLRAWLAAAYVERAMQLGTTEHLQDAQRICRSALGQEARCGDPLPLTLLHAVNGHLAKLAGDTDLAEREVRLSLHMALRAGIELGMLWALPSFLRVVELQAGHREVCALMYASADPWTRWHLVSQWPDLAHGAPAPDDHVDLAPLIERLLAI
ncbi:DNA-binding SARP family transcriptional activator/tetratricopeptide (TPR) repeat protein [Deinococcus metalli]|uniref:DNA-binding SARP family transcriptional activator/tetratricopeptide (TPR) repeat protein n=1 Tax=Deinococcus metalli TaxID=1141878 RepID=A0A7W8KJ70_9DEIO|nr:AAA family ATPase [Deinococcus metalli]MBB5379166.1 DNA-binding SARP family transcriptional activator/tetratricopeptide (TPR) repeat protein [Deinococcus metalli]GHF64636.1 SARP family transcriptional regulator [Deinococcus metalli]